MSERLGDHVKYGTVEDVEGSFAELADRCASMCRWMEGNLERSELNLALFNFLASLEMYLKIASLGTRQYIPILALAVRSIFEMGGRLRTILSSKDALDMWKSEALTDHIQVVEGILSLDTEGRASAHRSQLSMRLIELNEMAERHRIKKIRHSSASDVAKRAGTNLTHRAFFGLFSKLIHPSSFLINSVKTAHSEDIRNILQINAQLYAIDIMERLHDYYHMPPELGVPARGAH